MTPAVSICIPAYNQPELLARTLESIFAQDFQDFELIITDDSTTEAVSKVVSRWQKDTRVIYQRNTPALGSPRNWNAALGLARADLIKFMHHDDWFTNDKGLGHFVSIMQENPEIDLTFSAAKACENDGRLIFIHQPSIEQIERIKSCPLLLQFSNIIGPPSSTIFRKRANFQFDTNLIWVVDIDAYLCLLGTKLKFRFIPETLISVSSNGNHQITTHVAKDFALKGAEQLYLYAKHQPKKIYERLKSIAYLSSTLNNLDQNSLISIKKQRKHMKTTTEEKILLTAHELKQKVIQFLIKIKTLFPKKGYSDSLPKASYSQSGEDMIIDFLFRWLGIENITYLDIGAHHPKWLSNTYYFYSKGNTGILIEPDADLCINLQKHRPKDVILNQAVGISGEHTMLMYVMTTRTLNTLDKKQAEDLQAQGFQNIESIREVKATDINHILFSHFSNKKLNLVSLDVEGLDLAILEAWDFNSFRPEVFCVETLTYTQNNTEKKLMEIIELLQSKGYKLYADTYINSIFVCLNAWGKRPIVG